MNHTYLLHATQLSDAELVSHVQRLAGRGRQTTAELIAHLAELETRRLHLAAGYGSTFSYCRHVLLLSEHEAYHRIVAARTVRRFPLTLDLLAEGVVNLTTVKLLAPHLTEENHARVLESARGLSRRRVEELVTSLAPRPDVPISIRKLPEPRPMAAPPAPTAPANDAAPDSASSLMPVVAPTLALATTPGATAPALARAGAPGATASPVVARPNAAPAVVSPLSPDRYKLQLTIRGAVLETLELAKDLLRHAIPSGDDAAILERALKTLVAELTRQKFAVCDRPRPGRSVGDGSRHIPADVKRAVFLRDLGRCAFVGAGGRRCGERAFIEFHHVRPYADDGVATIENIELRCRRHNQYEWQLRVDPPRTATTGALW
jgi:hypothetical protein